MCFGCYECPIQIDENLLASVVKMGFDKEETIQAIKNHTTNKSTVIYHLLHDTRKDVKKEFENAPLPQNIVDEKERNAERITISRTWTLGIQLKGQPTSLMVCPSAPALYDCVCVRVRFRNT